MLIYDAIEIMFLIGYIINDVICRIIIEEVKMIEMMIKKINKRIKYGKKTSEKIQEILNEKEKICGLNVFKIPLNVVYVTRHKTTTLLDNIEDYMEYAVLEHDVENHDDALFKFLWRNYERAINFLLSSEIDDEQPRYVTLMLLYIHYKITEKEMTKMF